MLSVGFSLAGVYQDNVSAGAGSHDDFRHYGFDSGLERLYGRFDLDAEFSYACDGAL